MLGKIKSIYRKLMEGTVYVQAPLKAFELDDRILKEKYGLEVQRLNYDSPQDINLWCSLINNSYEDFSFTEEKAKRFLIKHPYMADCQSYILRGGGYASSYSLNRSI